MNKAENMSKWNDLVNDQISSGQTQVQWCAENNVNIHNFKYWKKRLGQTTVKQEKKPLGFVSLKPALKDTHIIKVCIGASTIEINESVDLNLFEDIVKVLVRHA